MEANPMFYKVTFTSDTVQTDKQTSPSEKHKKAENNVIGLDQNFLNSSMAKGLVK